MPQKFTGADGKQYYDGGMMGPIPAEEIDGPPKPGFFQRAGQMVHDAAPEIAGGVAGALAPETGGLSLLAGPLAAGATEAGKEYLDSGTVDPMTVLKRAGLNAIPGVAGKALSGIFSRLVEGGVGPAVDAMASGNGVVGTLAKGAKAAFGGEADFGATPAARVAMNAGKDTTEAAAAKMALAKQTLAKVAGNPQAQAAVLLKLKGLAPQASPVLSALQKMLSANGLRAAAVPIGASGALEGQ